MDCCVALVKRSGVVDKPKKDTEFGRLYVIKMILKDGTEVHKVGMTNSDRSTDRMMEILRSFFMKYRYVPYTELRRDKKVRIPYIVETYMHNLLEEYSYTFDKKFDGSSEYFSIDEEAFLEYLDEFEYAEMLHGVTKMPKDRYEKICKAIDADTDIDKDYVNGKDDTIPF